ncbi:MAG: YbaN family protein [Mariniblastus sp.]
MSQSQPKTQTTSRADASAIDEAETQASVSVVKAVTGVRKALFIVLAIFFFLLGMVGAVLPGIPTTPFLLLMSYFLIRVSPALNQRVLAWPLVGKPIRDWQEKGGVTPRVKFTAYAMVTFLVGLSIVFGSLSWTLKAFVFVAALVGVYVVYRLPTIPN